MYSSHNSPIRWLEKLHKILAIEESLDQEEEEGKVEEEEMTTEGK
jgi:hypothetical protein